MKQTLTVSAIVLLQNEKKILEDTLHSIHKQNYQPVEIIVIDSSAERLVSELVIQYPELRYYHRPDQNKATNKNFGIHLARGEVIAFLNAEDMWTDHKLADQVNYLEAHPEVDIVQGLIHNVSRTARSLSLVECLNCTYEFINSGSLVYRRSIFDTVGMFDETLDIGEEIDWFVRAWEKNIVKISLNQIALLHGQSSPVESEKLLKLFQVQSLKLIKKQLIKRKEIVEISAKKQHNPVGLSKYIGNPYEELNTDFEPFTIICDDCWGYGSYHNLKIQYNTPFIDIRIEPYCFLELLKDPQGYLEAPLTFIERSKYDFVNNWRTQVDFPLAQLKNKIELKFVHSSDQEDCRRKWERRVKRINWNNLFIRFRDDPVVFKYDYLTEFDRLEYENKVCFTLKEYPEFDWAVCTPDYFTAIHNGDKIYDASKQYFDAISWVKKTYGSSISAYKVN